MTAHVGLRHRSASSSFQRMEEKHNNHNNNHNNNSKNNNEENSPPSLNESSDDESGTNHSHSSSSIHSDTDSCTKDSSSGSSSNNSSSRSSVPLKPKRKSLEDRGAIPAGMMFGIASISVMQWCADVPQNFFGTILPNVKYTVIESVNDLKLTAVYGCDLIMDLIHWRERPLKEYFVALIVLAFLSSIFFVLLIAPLRAGMWTNRTRIKRHKLHRYFGLLFLIAYTFAWIEFIFDYENRGKNSYLPHIISINGFIQATSAYFSFRVLPDLTDPGYYSDKAVLSRLFVHENIFFQIMSVWGSFLYHDQLRTSLQSHWIGRMFEIVFLFFPYVIVRRFFPTTRFSDAGSSKVGRSKTMSKYYDIGTFTVKIFYLWAKYFLNFFINWAVYLNLLEDHHWHCVRGTFLMNVGTISISVFLHTLRFKKVLPGPFTFSFYLLQIYSTFLFIPMAFDLFMSHWKLSLLCFLGLLMNMTRSRKVHTIWCVVSYILITKTDIEW